jgi:hypothetical protein
MNREGMFMSFDPHSENPGTHGFRSSAELSVASSAMQLFIELRKKNPNIPLDEVANLVRKQGRAAADRRGAAVGDFDTVNFAEIIEAYRLSSNAVPEGARLSKNSLPSRFGNRPKQ